MAAWPAVRALGRASWLMLASAGCDPSTTTNPSAPEQASGDAVAARDAAARDAAPEDAPCRDLGCLAANTLDYLPEREWRRSGAAPSLPTDELAESDYSPVDDAATVAVRFSQDAQRVELAAAESGAPVTGTRSTEHEDAAWYELDLFAGGRFVVRRGDDALQAEYTVYGSGVPIVKSTRGRLLSR